jgi:hypothetical protein
MDLKDLQRCWMLKAIFGRVPVGSRILEIGAGEPIVADILSRAGYDVTVVDPYDGSGNGPMQAAQFTLQYPNIRFHVGTFNNETPLIGHWDCFYSISVLEHIAIDELKRVFAGMKKFGSDHYTSIHAVDHVLLGAGSDYHRQMLSAVAEGCGVAESKLDGVIELAVSDVETYFLSAEAHNRWRGTLQYEKFPMRRCISMQFCCTN